VSNRVGATAHRRLVGAADDEKRPAKHFERLIMTSSEKDIGRFIARADKRNGKERRVSLTLRLALLSLAITLVGCQETVSFNVLRAAQVNVRGMTPEGHDPTVSIGEWKGVDASAASDIAQKVRELVTNAPGGVVKFAEAGGVVRLDGNLSEYKYEENVTSKPWKCTKHDDAANKNVEYPCTHFTRAGTARVAVSMNVIDATGKTAGAHTFSPGPVPKETEADDEQPPTIDWESVMGDLRGSAAVELAALVIPTPVAVVKRWFKCGDANEQCKAGLVQLKQGNFEPAQTIFRQAIDTLQHAPKLDAEATAAAWWALTLSQEFSGDYAGANASLKEAIKLDPSNETYAAEVSGIQAIKKNAERLGKQGVGAE
jgi:hypothetical protein